MFRWETLRLLYFFGGNGESRLRIDAHGVSASIRTPEEGPDAGPDRYQVSLWCALCKAGELGKASMSPTSCEDWRLLERKDNRKQSDKSIGCVRVLHASQRLCAEAGQAAAWTRDGKAAVRVVTSNIVIKHQWRISMHREQLAMLPFTVDSAVAWHMPKHRSTDFRTCKRGCFCIPQEQLAMLPFTADSAVAWHMPKHDPDARSSVDVRTNVRHIQLQPAFSQTPQYLAAAALLEASLAQHYRVRALHTTSLIFDSGGACRRSSSRPTGARNQHIPACWSFLLGL